MECEQDLAYYASPPPTYRSHSNDSSGVGGGGKIQERMGELRSPPSQRREIPVQIHGRSQHYSYSSSGAGGGGGNDSYSREFAQKMTGGSGFSDRYQSQFNNQFSTENYVPSTVSPRNYSYSNGVGETLNSSSRLTNRSFPSPQGSSGLPPLGQGMDPLPPRTPSTYPPTTPLSRGSFRESSVRINTGHEGPTEWSRREESIRESGIGRPSSLNSESRYSSSAAAAAALPPLNGSSLASASTPGSVRVTRKPMQVYRNGDVETITTETKEEDGNSETIYKRRTIRRRRAPSVRVHGQDSDISEEYQRSASASTQKRVEGHLNEDPAGRPPLSARPRVMSASGRFSSLSKIPTGPPRTYSQTNIQQMSSSLRNQWNSENNLRGESFLKQPVIRGTYSAHQENLRRKNEMSQQSENAMPDIKPVLSPMNLNHFNNTLKHRRSYLRSSRRMSETGYGEICQEIVSLLPIGRGVQDLESGSNAATLPRAGSHTAVDADRMSTTSKYSIGSNIIQRPPSVTAAVKSPKAVATGDTLRQSHEGVFGRSHSTSQASGRHQQAVNSPLRRSFISSGSRPQLNYSAVATPLMSRNYSTRSYSASGTNRGQYYSGTQSPAPHRHGGRVVSEHRQRTIQNESHWTNVNGLGSSMGSLHGGSYSGVPIHLSNHMGMDSMDSRHTLNQTNDMSYHWFRPNASRQDAVQLLINKEPGRFIVRNSKSQPDAYALAVRVPITPDDSEPVRTFLLNRVKGGDAVHLRGFESEPVFPSLSAFVHDHTIHQGALPVLLKLPMRGAVSSNYLVGGMQSPAVGRHSSSSADFASDVLYLGSVDVFPLQGESAVRRAVEQILSLANNPMKGLKKKCEATVLCSVDKGITIMDKNSTRFSKKTIPPNKILYCAYDPEERVFNAIELKNRGVADSQLFAIVVKKTRFTMTEHAVYVMCQLEPHQPSSSLINFINQNMPVHYR